jgi:hypothetical protein
VHAVVVAVGVDSHKFCSKMTSVLVKKMNVQCILLVEISHQFKQNGIMHRFDAKIWLANAFLETKNKFDQSGI